MVLEGRRRPRSFWGGSLKVPWRHRGLLSVKKGNLRSKAQGQMKGAQNACGKTIDLEASGKDEWVSEDDGRAVIDQDTSGRGH